MAFVSPISRSRARASIGATALTAGVIAAASPGCSREQVHHVDLTFRTETAGISGFDCRITNMPGETFLTDRVLPEFGGNGKISIVIDFAPLGGNPRCDPNSLLDWCASHDCSSDDRICVERDVAVTAKGQPTLDAVGAVLQSLHGTTLASTLPADDQVQIVRVVATTQPCSAIGTRGTRFDCKALVGCAYSCPVIPSNAESAIEVVLDLGLGGEPEAILEAACQFGVATCARTPLSNTPECTL